MADGVSGSSVARCGLVTYMTRWVLTLLTEPLVRHLDPDAPDITVAHRNVLRRKPMLWRLFEGFYRECCAMDERYFRSTSVFL